VNGLQALYPFSKMFRLLLLTYLFQTDLINLLERSQEHLTPKQSSEVKHLLKEYERLFAASDSDYGRPVPQ
jgi:hypothetical protein